MIQARFEDARLLVTPPPLTLVLDGTQWGPRQAEVATALMAAAGRTHSATTMAFWSTGQALDDVPVDSFAAEHSLGARGRFATPLVEGGLLGAGSLACFVGGRVPDWEDWSDEIERRFERRASVVLASGQAALTGTTAIDGTVADLAAVERAAITATLGVHVTRVALRFDHCVPAVAPEGFVGREDDGRLVLEWVGDAGSVIVELAVASEAGGGRVEVDALDTDGGRAAVAATLPEVEPEAPRWRPYASDEAARVHDALAAYGQGIAVHSCPCCGREHSFARAFRCERARGGSLFAAARGLCLPTGLTCAPRDCIALRSREGALEAAVVGRGPAVWLGDATGVRTPGGWSIFSRDGSLASRLTQVWPALSADTNGRLWIVETS